ncbi:hypothetical protein [Emticicia agri]|uniref:Nuclear transport factor 2 family protein n=1 Tax=Emticicia agri TaxID=2492393 RepID=A0A4Q5M2Q0_9BACT|nr:hypothetical protein [Emticicia agri]RYU96309.1 hypothetical protein EWM59_07295 [Emticicia agri]
MPNKTQYFFKDYAAALMSFSPENIADYYRTPMAVYSDQGVLTVTKGEEVVDFWKQGLKQYSSQDINKAECTILLEDKVSETVYLCKVQWDNYSESGKKVSSETNYYILAAKDGRLGIVGLIITGK